MNRWLSQRHIYPLVILTITVAIAVANYIPGTWLTGWDTLHPEFNFTLNFSRILNGVWREEQGLGTVAAHAHMSEFPRYLILWLASWIAPLSSLRYLYIFLCFISGPLGMYYFLVTVLHEQDKDGHTPSEGVIEMSAFLGALFYIFNLAVLHQFLVPFEMFPTKYALLPWLFLFATKYIRHGHKHDLIWFGICTFFSTPMAYAFQLWYVYLGSLTLYLVAHVFICRTFALVRRVATVLIVTVGINAYWFLPHLYFLAESAKNIPLAHANLLFSERMFAFNKARGDLWDVAILQGALYDWSKFDGQGFIPLFSMWKTHLDNPLVIAIGFIGFAMILIGIVRLFHHRNHSGYALIPVWLVAFIFMANTSWPFDSVFTWIRNHIMILKEGLRSPYTKFSITLLFTYTFFFAFAQLSILETFKKNTRKYYMCTIGLIFIFYMYPFFTGNLIDRSMKQIIPPEYFAMFDWFDKQPKETRIATLPVHSFWGWEYYKWGYQGAGFIWFGLPQSVLVRDFDRWNPGNENFYWEFSYAIYAQKPELIRSVLNKYQVSWLVVDHNVISPPNPKSLYFDEFKNMLANIPEVQLVKKFGRIDVYQVRLNLPHHGWITVHNDMPSIAPLYKWNNDDQAYQDTGGYTSVNEINADNRIIYPFRSIFTGRAMDQPVLSIDKKDDVYLLRSSIIWNASMENDYHLTSEGKQSFPTLDGSSLVEGSDAITTIVNYQGKLTARIPMINEYYTYDSNDDPGFLQLPLTRCDTLLRGPMERYQLATGGMRFTGKNASNCIDILIPQLDQRYSYLVEVESKNISGSPFLFSIQNLESKKSEAETYLNQKEPITYFVIPPLKHFGKQYAIHFDSIAIGEEKAVNDLYRVRVQRIPYDFLHTLKLVKIADTVPQPIISFSQNYDTGWVAYDVSCDTRLSILCKLKTLLPMMFAKRLTHHLLVDNWANGWKITQSDLDQQTGTTNYVVVFLPQFLELAGFLIMAGTVIWIAKKPINNK